MHVSSLKAHLLAVVILFTSSASASTLDTRASGLTLPDIFKNGTTQVTALRQQLNRAIVFNKTVSDPALVQSILTQISSVIDSTASQVNKTGKLPFDQVSGGLSQDEIGYISTDFLNAVTLSLVAPQSVVASFPQIQKGIDAVK
ncbi:hypothetical protein FRB90_001137 [Tulasnella sp. 427]|nr:hypothetical protein FRB90_001137 [Tulasnella sp. 427]